MQEPNAPIVNSALWAAYGDALGFITELANGPKVIEARVGTAYVSQTVAWTRRIGGRFGIDCKLPAGCYSDDTQLRLATCRAIRSDGSFDVEAFAKMELPVWTSYALGAGRGSKAAATALSRDGVTWFSNFYQGQGGDYIAGGGNGAAMRIQPHVWAAKKGSDSWSITEAIVKNAICTHGHARGILGAVFHGHCLQHVLALNEIPAFDALDDIVESLSRVPDVVESNADLRLFWLPFWEQRAESTFRDECAKVQTELIQDISLLSSLDTGDPSRAYKNAVQRIGGFGERERGSGTKTALLSAFLSILFQREGAEEAILTASNLLGSDTDSIASMAGALLGCLEPCPPRHQLADREYVERLARRMASIGKGEAVEHVQYPDIMKWSPPRTQQDSVVVCDEGLEVLILGKVKSEGESFSAKRADSGVWQWLSLESGQSILAKRRIHPSPIQQDGRQLVQNVEKNIPMQVNNDNPQMEFFANSGPCNSLDELTKQAIRSNFDPKIIGEHVLLLTDLDNGIEKAIGYVAIIAKAKLARRKA